MAEQDQQAISILLPSSVVAIYSTDDKTLDSARTAMNDWRFARVQIQAIEGDIDTAIGTYQSEASPDLIIIQTDSTESVLTDKLEKLAPHCEEDTAAIIIGPDNDVNLYRALVDMGVSDYLVAPIEADDLADVIARTLVDRLGVSDSRLIAFIGAKGGVGTSALAQAAAWSAADILKQKTILIDGAGGWSTLSVGMGFEPSTTLAEAAKAAAAEDEESLERMIENVSDKLSVLASGGDIMLDPTLRTDQMEDLVGMLMVKYPVVIADLSMTPPVLQKTILMRANHIVVVSTPSLPALRLARSLMQEIQHIRGDHDGDVDLMINMQGIDKPREVSMKDIKEAMGVEPASVLPFDGAVFIKSESEGKKVIDKAEGRQIVKTSILPVLRKVLALKADDADEAEPTAKEGLLDNVLKKLKTKGS